MGVRNWELKRAMGLDEVRVRVGYWDWGEM